MLTTDASDCGYTTGPFLWVVLSEPPSNQMELLISSSFRSNPNVCMIENCIV